MRGITKDRHHAEELLRAVERRSIDAAALKLALTGSFSGRLAWDGKRLSYSAGQYFPTEYRRAVFCTVGLLAGPSNRNTPEVSASWKPGLIFR